MKYTKIEVIGQHGTENSVEGVKQNKAPRKRCLKKLMQDKTTSITEKTQAPTFEEEMLKLKDDRIKILNSRIEILNDIVEIFKKTLVEQLQRIQDLEKENTQQAQQLDAIEPYYDELVSNSSGRN